MREIKFRVWNMATKTMIDLRKTTSLILNVDTDGLFIPFSDGLPFMQLTGLKDKRGTWIYEGDILRFAPLLCLPFSEEITIVSAVPLAGLYGLPGYLGFMGQSEIIGNIYEHPELLK